MRPDKYDRQGKPLEPFEWARLLGDRDYQRIAVDEIGPLRVSTVWLGLDHSFGDGPPLIFETMTFPSSAWNMANAANAARPLPDWSGLFLYRYATEQDAQRGHALIVAKLTELFARPGITPGDVRAQLARVNPLAVHDA